MSVGNRRYIGADGMVTDGVVICDKDGNALSIGGSGGSLPSAIFAGQKAVTTSPAALPNVAVTNNVVVKASLSNKGNVFVGASGVTTTYDGTGTGYPLAPGEAMGFVVANLNAIYIIGTAGDVVSYTGN